MPIDSFVPGSPQFRLEPACQVYCPGCKTWSATCVVGRCAKTVSA